MLNKISFVLTRNEKKGLAGLAIGSVLLALSETVSIGLIIPITSLFMSDGPVGSSKAIGWLQGITGLHDRTVFLTVLIAVTMVIFLFKSVYSVFMLRSQYDFTSGIYCRLTGKVMSSYLYSPYSFHLNSNSSVLFKNMIGEVGQFTSGFLSPAIIIASESLVFIAILTLLMYVYPVMTIALAAMLFMMMLSFNLFVNRKIKDYSRERETYSEAIYVMANEALSGIKEIQVNSVQDYFIKRFSTATRKYQDSFTKFSVLSNLPRYIMESAVFFIMLAALLISLHLHRPPSELVPMLTVMGAAAIKLLPSINKIYLSYNSINYFANSLDVVYSILKDVVSPQTELDAGERAADGAKDGTSAFRLAGAGFSYKEGGPSVLDGLDLDIPFFSTTAIVGASGAGKSTLIDIFTGLLTPTQGTLYYRGTVVNARNLHEVRKKIGYVPQNIFLIDDTIKANIAFGKAEEAVDHKLIDQAVRLSNLESFIGALPKGIDTPTGERGVRLSGGQRQRIGIARALYRNPEVLILDEATSALDGNSEAEVMGAIKKMKDAGMAVILVAHRLSTISNADLVCIMDHGKVGAKGSFKELHDNSDLFNKILHEKDNMNKKASAQ